MLNANTENFKIFLQQAIELNSLFIRMKIQSDAANLLPYEESLRALKSQGGTVTCSKETHNCINSIIRLKQELKQMQRLTEMIGRV
jgi:hypothetical protein